MWLQPVPVGSTSGWSSAHPSSYVLPAGERLPLHLGGAGKIFQAALVRVRRELIRKYVTDLELLHLLRAE